MNEPRSSRGLAEILFKLARATPNGESIVNLSTGKQTLPIDRGAALVDAWVQVREAQAKRDQHQSEHGCENTTRGAWEGYNCRILANLEAALTAARKELEPERMQPAGEANDRQGGE